MAEKYEPELCQALFGQAPKELKVPVDVQCALEAIRYTISTLNSGIDNPFNNCGSRYKWANFQAHSYSWSEDDQRFNFKWRDFEVSWYKYFGRGLSMNRRINSAELRLMLSICLEDVLSHPPQEDW